ncbi:hypothetical protein [Arthrobacter sp. ISL-30]|uniref:ATP-dependent DNA ligase n=1 Tax=Arthrobacter sp. ISL-30 TaxID=2819109 RepID=UPI001BEB1417|nr:hypothetical protein [Arthrobacter sp. ISL-30]MBT2513150.1 hypothetical protein [Arthrobacter sp. ISL-30]
MTDKFISLQVSDITVRPRVRELPASFAGFDVLCVAGRDIRDLPLRDRRALLEELATAWSPPLSLSPMTMDRKTAEQWLEDLPAAGLEGLMIKGPEQPYESGKRAWLKLKRRSAVDIV